MMDSMASPKENWKTTSGKRIRSPDDSGNNNSTKAGKIQTKLSYWLGSPIKTKNKYQPLEETSKLPSSSESVQDKPIIQKSPPIFVSGVNNFGPLKELLNNIAKDNYTLKLLSNNQVKIQPSSSENYLPIVEELKKRNTEFYTYQMKKDKTYKVVLRNMHPSVDINELKSEIEVYNHKVVRISNIRQSVTQKPLPLFFIEIETNVNNKQIYEIDKLLNLVVSIEAPRKKRDIPQCMKCQGYGHTKNYCYKSAVCVKCAENHLTSDCKIKEKTNSVKCANCEGNHPASYKGCLVRKQLQQKLFPQLREKNLNRNTTASQGLAVNNNMVRPSVSYAQVTADTSLVNIQAESNTSGTITQAPNVNNNINKLEVMISQLMSKIDTMLNLITCLINKIK